MTGNAGYLDIAKRCPFINPTNSLMPKIVEPQIDTTCILGDARPLVAQSASSAGQASGLPVPPREQPPFLGIDGFQHGNGDGTKRNLPLVPVLGFVEEDGSLRDVDLAPIESKHFAQSHCGLDSEVEQKYPRLPVNHADRQAV